MAIEQLTAFVENKPGKLVEITKLLAGVNVDMRALSIADNQGFGILRLIVDDTASAVEALKTEGVLVQITPVVGVRLDDRPGALSAALEVLDKAGVNVEYIYAFLASTPGCADMVLRVADNAAAESILAEAGFDVL